MNRSDRLRRMIEFGTMRSRVDERMNRQVEFVVNSLLIRRDFLG